MGEALLNVGVGTLLGSGIGTIAGVTARRLDIKEVARDSGVPDDIFPEQQRIRMRQMQLQKHSVEIKTHIKTMVCLEGNGLEMLF